MVDKVLDIFQKNYAPDLIDCIWGHDAQLYAEDFFVTDRMYNKYNNHILKNLQHIQGKNIVSIGSHTGWLEVLALLSGANSVVCIEPRKKFTDGIQKFAKNNSLSISAICNFHNHLFDIGKKFDTVVAFNSIGHSLDWMTYVGKLHTVANHLVFVKGVWKDLPNNSIRLEQHNDSNIWGGLRTQQATALNFHLGQGFFEILCKCFGYKIVQHWEDVAKQPNQYYVVDLQADLNKTTHA